MEVKINYKYLSDSPYCDANSELFSEFHPDLENFVTDIKNGLPTCYLVSGYRGTGKSSFINKVEQSLKNESTNNKELVFINTYFSKYENQTYLLRKLIRGLYLNLSVKPSFQKLKVNQSNQPIENQSVLVLEKLYERTFFDSHDVYNQTLKDQSTELFKTKIPKVLLPLAGLSFTILFIINIIHPFADVQKLFNFLGVFSSVLLLVSSIYDYVYSKESTETEIKELNRKSLYDDEIADYHFYNMLHQLGEHYRIVYVLDELDKVDDDEINALLKEMKPYLVCGKASFIVVAGQNLYYKYFHSNSVDDAILSSLFSRFVHINLGSRIDMYKLFDKIMLDREQLSSDQLNVLNNFRDYAVFESKYILRKFINLLRQHIVWENDTAYIVIEEDRFQEKFYSEVLVAIDHTFDKFIVPEIDSVPIRDFFKMQLMISAHKLRNAKVNAVKLEDLI